MPNTESPNEIIVILFSFLLIDLLLKRSYERFDWIVDKKNETLISVIRPLIRMIEKIQSQNSISQVDIDSILEAYDKIYPSPRLEHVKKIENLKPSSYISKIDDQFLNEFKTFLVEMRGEYKHLTVSYSGRFLALKTPDGITFYFALFLSILSQLWIPFFFFYYFMNLSTSWLLMGISLLVVAVFMGRKNWKDVKFK